MRTGEVPSGLREGKEMTITLLAGVFVLSVVILIHELGHFVMAKLVGIYVKTFSIGFGRKLLRFKGEETEYALSALPFGGYVKMAGEAEEEEEQEGEEAGIDPERFFRNKSTIQRSAVVFSGPFMNYLLAVFIYFTTFFFLGIQVLPTTTIGEVERGSPADSAGLEPGDRVLAVAGKQVSNWSDFMDELLTGEDREKIL